MWREQLFEAGTLGVVTAILGVAAFFALITVITSRRLASRRGKSRRRSVPTRRQQPTSWAA